MEIMISLAIAVALAGIIIYLLIQRQKVSYGRHVGQFKANPPKRHKRATEFNKYTRADVARHCTRDDAWVIIQHKESGTFV